MHGSIDSRRPHPAATIREAREDDLAHHAGRVFTPRFAAIGGLYIGIMRNTDDVCRNIL